MSSPLVAARPGGDDILPAHATQPTLIHRFGADPHDETAPALWLSEGLSNAWQVTTPTERMIVNTGMGFEGPVHRRCFDQVSGAPVRYIAFTQGHVDHVGGTDCFTEASTDILAQAANLRCQADDARIHRFRVKRSMIFWADAVAKADAFLRQQPADPAARPTTQATPTPTVTFDDHLSLQLGDLSFELHSLAGGETVDSLAVWFPTDRVAIVGNAFSALFGHVPNLTTVRGDRPRDPLAFIEMCDRVLALEPELLCVGHFAPITGAATIRSEVTRIRDAMRWLHDAVVDGMNRGRTVDQLAEDLRWPDDLSLGEGYGTLRWAVRAIWQGYAGWFEFRSTTELHGIPADSVWSDLVRLAGADAIVTTAREHLAADRPLPALHLLEPVLSTEPSHRGALEAEIDAHQHLLDGDAGTNFWEAGWLRHRISESRRNIAALETRR